MSMTLLPCFVTTTNTKKRKKKKSKKQEEVDADHIKFLNKVGYKGSRSLTVKHRNYNPHVSRLESNTGSTPVGTTNLQNSGNSYTPDQFYNQTSSKQPPNVYSGERKLLGIATMHKSHMTPVFSKEDAEAISKMSS